MFLFLSCHQFLSFLVVSIIAVTVLFSYLIAVSIKFFSSQPVICTFCASSSPLHPGAGRREGRGGVSK